MFRIRLNKIQNNNSIQRNLFQLCFNYFENKRNIFLLIIFLFLTPTIYLISHEPIEQQIIEETNICTKLIEIIYNSNTTLCSEEANHRGNQQRIIALSVFGPKQNKLFAYEKFSELIYPLINEAKIVFPKWIIRLYSDELTINRLNLYNLTQLSTNIDICNVNRIPILGNVEEYLPGKLWRFLSTLDPTVDLASSRDLDSPLIERERVIMEEFINSDYLFLVIRDHPMHGIPILGGLWTAALSRNRLLFLHLFSILIEKHKAKKYTLNDDQKLLHELIWPKIKNQTLSFDSYTCDKFHEGNVHPFPTQRTSRECHVGCVRPCCENSSDIIFHKPCPEQCRPKDHPDWIYC